MAATKTKPLMRPKQHPVFKVGPLSGGISVAVWNNEIEMDGGKTRTVRSVSVSPRRCLDHRTGAWRNTNSFRPNDLSAVIMALQ